VKRNRRRVLAPCGIIFTVSTATKADFSAQLDSLVSQIVEAVHPVRIILFGSAARGEMGPDSDFDLLVVMPDGTPRRKTARHLYRVVEGGGAAKDILVTTVSELAKYADNIGLIYRTILREGKTVYES
jgi:predicted nucleotidyltransferase